MMMRPLFKQALMCFAMLAFVSTRAEKMNFLSEKDYERISELNRNGMECQKLCIGKILTKCLKARHVKSEHLDSDSITTHGLCSDSINTNQLCANIINAVQQICAPAFNAPMICTEELTANNICARGTIKANDFQQCGKYRATVVFSADIPYTLGDDASFDAIIDDPNGDVISIFPTVYRVPLSGYYMITLQFDSKDLTGAEIVLGTPVSNIEILVNGVLFRQSYAPFLSFHNGQNATISGLISLTAGDLITTRYNVLVMTDTGFTPYAGTITMLGNGTEENASMLKIHYLSSNCTDQVECPPCTLVPCTSVPCSFPCASMTDCCNMSCCDNE